MPYYPYRDESSGKVVEVLREVSDRGTLPTYEECTHPEIGEPIFSTAEEYQRANWTRLIGRGIKVSYKQGSLKGRMNNA